MNGILTLLAIVLAIMILVLVPPMAAPYAERYGTVTVVDCANALLLCGTLTAIVGLLIRRVDGHRSYLLRLFLLALFARVAIGAAIFAFNGQNFFGGDAWTYDYYGGEQLLAWRGDAIAASHVDSFLGKGLGSGWGMMYLVAAIYGIIGRNMLAIQFLNAVLGAATAVLMFLSVKEIFNNVRVAKLAAIGVAFYPSLILWSAQGLKDAPIVFSLAVCILVTLRLGKKFSFVYLTALIVSLTCVLTLRFYVFYMMLVAVGGAFLVGVRALSAQSLVRQFVIMMALGLSLTYVGVTRYANAQFEQYGSLEQLQRSRLDASKSESGFGRDVDLSTGTGALQTIPIGLLYLLFAPFPWQLGSLRQSLTLPEMLIWWASFPLLILGLWYSLRYRLRQMSPILIFTTMLTLSYSVFQGNVGTAYRQRAQLLVFYFIFVAVGLVLVKEKREEKARQKLKEKEESRQRLRWGPDRNRSEDHMPVAG